MSSPLFIYLSILILISSVYGNFDRKWTTKLNPDCPKSVCDNSNISIIYAKGVSSEDSLHFIYSGGNFTETLSVLLLRSSDKNTTAKINYEALIDKYQSIVEGNFTEAFGLIFTILYEYNDVTNKADMKGSDWQKYFFNQFSWDKVLDHNKQNDKVLFYQFKSSKIRFVPWSSNTTIEDTIKNSNIFGTGGSIQFNFNVSSLLESSDYMPRLKYSRNNTLFDLIMDHLNSTYKNSRFAIQLAVINKINIGPMSIKETKSLDDEESPGVFRIKNVMGQLSSVDKNNSMYVQWKPVCFLSPIERSLKTISVTSNYELKALSLKQTTDYTKVVETIRDSLVFKYFGESIFWENNTMQLINITFGQPDDKYYAGSKYLVWSGSFGQGDPPYTSLSFKIVMVIAFGLGLPFVLIVIGSIYVCVKRICNKYHQI